MAVFDSQERRLVIRVVYDGPAFAGKTTNLRKLNELFPTQRRSEMYTPGALKGRTMFFDWLEIEGGRVGGVPFRCQLLTVPGQGLRSYRRRPLLESADAVVFVCDSTPEALADSKKSFSQLRVHLRKRAPQIVPVIVQANKQDDPNAMPPEELAHALRLDETAMILPCSAHTGAGVKNTVTTAMRAALRELQRRIQEHGIGSLSGNAETADDLFNAMLELEDGERVQMLDEQDSAGIWQNSTASSNAHVMESTA